MEKKKAKKIQLSLPFIYITGALSLLIMAVFRVYSIFYFVIFLLIVLVIYYILRRYILVPFVGSPDERISYYTKILARKPRDGLSYYNRGVVYFHQANYDKALDDISKAIQFISLEPPRYGSYAYDFRGRIFFMQGKYKEAIADYSKGIEINPYVPTPYVNRARAYFELKEYDRSWDDVHKVESLKPEEDYEGDLVEITPEFLEELKKASCRER